MKILVLLFAALLVAGCGEKSSSEGSESVSEKPTAPSEEVKPTEEAFPQFPFNATCQVARLLSLQETRPEKAIP